MVYMNNKTQIKYKVYGLVQGVGFRYFVYRHASELKLKGYAKNLWDGTVEIVVEGEESKVNALHDYLLQGPSRARVDKVEKFPGNYSGTFTGFEIY